MRNKIRNNIYTGPTSGILEDYLQLNVLIIPDSYADDFEVFAKKNPKAIPLIERGQGLKFKAIGETIDIKRDIPKYRIHNDGSKREVLDLTEENLESYTAFAVGCSYTFETALVKQGINLRHIELNKNVAMYNTSIPCQPSVYFSGDIVVSMRPIKKESLSKVFEITSSYSRVHGLPIHVGNPSAIGIEDITKPEYGEFVEIAHDEVPVFWACGVSSERIVNDSIEDKFYTHAPGHMLIGHMKTSEILKVDYKEELTRVLYEGLESRGLFGKVYQNDLEDFASDLLKHQSILLISGFCVGPDLVGETDGPVGTVFLARSLMALGKDVSILTDRFSKKLFDSACQALDLGPITCLEAHKDPDLLMAIERPGKASNGSYHNMRGLDISHLVDETDTLIESYQSKGIPFYAIGDGGNEVGMGKIKDYIYDNVPHGQTIAADIAADKLLISGVSNWGAYALIGMLSILSKRTLIQSLAEEDLVYDAIVHAGAIDGVTKRNEKSIDGFSMDKNLEVLQIIRNTVV